MLLVQVRVGCVRSGQSEVCWFRSEWVVLLVQVRVRCVGSGQVVLLAVAWRFFF